MLSLSVHLKLDACRLIPKLGFWTSSLDLWIAKTLSAFSTCSSLHPLKLQYQVLFGFYMALLSFKGIFAELLKAAKMKNNQTQVKEGTPAA